jgi:serine/threonine protein kinase
MNDTVLMVRCASAQGAFLCCIGRLIFQDKKHLLDQQIVRSYIKNYKPQPEVFMQFEKSWTLPPETFPVAMNSKNLGVSWDPELFTMKRVDVDSLHINNFRVTTESIRDRLTRILGRAQIDVGTAWTSVKPPKNYHIVSSPRPVVMVYCEESQENEMKNFFAEQLGADTFSTFLPSKDSHNVFCQAASSVDVKTLFTVWLKVVQKFRNEEDGISRMELIRIIFHGWKSDPECIIDPFDEVGMYHKCKQDCAEFSASYDIAHKYVANAHTCITKMAKRDTRGTSKVHIPTFGPDTKIPGFSANNTSVWSMFGPLAGENPVGSMKLDRTDLQNATSLPLNVTRIKIYSSVVNLTKNIMRLSGVDVHGLTHKRLKYQGKKVAEFLNELVLNWQKYAQVLMSFRVECTLELSDAKYNLRELILLHKSFQKQLLNLISATTTMSLIAVSDIDSLSRWCLKKYMRLSAGDDKKKFHDEEMAKDMLLSLWHTIGYHHLGYTQHKHARFLIELDMQNVDMNTTENQQTKLLKTVLPASDFEWSDETKTSNLLQALTFMTVRKFTTKKKPDTFFFRYMYKKICTATSNGHQCPWCYSSKKMLKKLEDQQDKTHATMTACRSNNFATPVELALDVQARLEYHLQSCNPSKNNWDINRIQHVIGSLFFKCTEQDKHNQNQEIIRAIQLKMPIKNADADEIPAERLDHKPNESQESEVRSETHVDIDIDDLFRDEFDSFDDAIRDLCEDMRIPCSTLSSEWMTFFEPKDQMFIKLSDCVYASKHFAKGNAKCHFAWNPRTQKPMCIKLISSTSGNNHEKNMLEKLMKHTGQKPGQHNIVEYFGHEIRQSHICLKFEFVHPKNSFRKDLTNMTCPKIVTYMRELLKALDSLHNNYGITHRDIKPDNFVHHFQTNTFRLIDFGSAVYMRQNNGIGLENAGTRGFKAPELLQPSYGESAKGFKRHPSIDIWSAGIIFMSLLTGQKDILSRNDEMATVDCNAKHLKEIGNIVGKNNMKHVNATDWSIYGDGCKEGGKTGWAAKALQLCKRPWTPSDEALDLLSKMLNVCPRQRITSDAALKHPFLLNDDDANVFDQTAHTAIEGTLETGLPNDKKWCYLNSVLQCLKHSTELSNLMIENQKTYQLTVKDKYFFVTRSLHNFLVSTINQKKIEAVSELRRHLNRLNSAFDGNTQQDAVEVCELLLQGMCSAYATPCPVNDIIKYAFTTRMECKNCGDIWYSAPEEEFVAKLAVPTNYCLQSAINNWCKPETREILDDVTCSTCNQQKVNKVIEIVLAPNVFILQMKIFDNDGTKIHQPIKNNHGSTVKVGPHDYRVFAVVSHVGASLRDGHFISYAEKNAIWACFDDDKVTSNKHWQTDSDDQGNETPYVFFLRKIEGRAAQREVDGAGFSDQYGKDATECNGTGHPNACTSQQNDNQQLGSITVGNNVLARQELNAEWTMAIVTGCQGDNYEVHFVENRETRCVTVQNIKPLDWQYWQRITQSWTWVEFQNAMVEWETPKDWIMRKSIQALDDLQIGTVVAQYFGYRDNVNLNLGESNSTNDFNCELVWVRDQSSGQKETESFAAFLVTTKYVHKGQQLTWYNEYIGASVEKEELIGFHAIKQTQKEESKNEANGNNGDGATEQDSDGSDINAIPVGNNVLIRLEEGTNWTLAIMEQRRDSLYEVYSISLNKKQLLSRKNIKSLHWNYWKKEFKSWTYAKFKDALALWNMQVGATVYPDMGRGLQALEDCQIGTVVAEYSGYIAHKDDGFLYMGGLYPEMDECMREHLSVRTMQNEQWKDRKNHSITLGRSLSQRFCIDGYATTCSTLDNIQDHGSVGWGALLNAARKSKSNCSLVWVSRPNIVRVDQLEHLQKEECMAAFLVTHKNVCKGEQLTWYYKGACYIFQ